MQLFENTIIQFENISDQELVLERILWISEDRSKVVLMNIMNRKKMQFPYFRSYQDLIQLIEDGVASTYNLEPDIRLIKANQEYSKRHIDNRDIKWEIIKSIVMKEPEIYYPESRGLMVREVMKITGKQRKTIHEWIKKYWFYGKSINGLLNNYFDCGVNKRQYSDKKAGPKAEDGNEYIIRDEDKENFLWAIKKFHIEQGLTITETHKKLLQHRYKTGFYREFNEMVPIVEPEKCPTLRMFRYWYQNNFNSKQKYSARYGERKAEMNARAFKGTPEENVQGPGAYYEIDSTPADVILVSLDRETVIGRAHVYFVKDVMSRMIVGVHICITPSWEEEMVALENASTNKVEYCKRFGIEITEEDWPCLHLPKFIVGDRGEHKSRNSNNLVDINVRVGNTPSYRGDFKPYIEQQFRRYNARIRESIPVSAVRKEHRERGDKNPENYAVHTIEAFSKLTILFVLEFNKSALPDEYLMTREMFEEKVELTPLGIWNWGLKKNLLHEMPRDLIRLKLLPKGEGIVTRSGITFKKMSFSSDRGFEEKWFEQESIYGQKKVVVNYDPRNCSSIFISLKDGTFEPCFLTPKFNDYRDLHFNDVKVLLSYKNKQLKQLKKQRVNIEGPLDAVAESLSLSEKEKTKEAQRGMPKSGKFKNKRLARNLDKRMTSSEDAWTTVKREEDIKQVSNEVSSNSENTNRQSEITKMTEMQLFLMSKNKERRENRGNEK
ncbi:MULTISPECIES: Mu transposase C-terminal domain-containing protein [Psychrobacillus]|uniref:Mu transposase C-terminal domain-containing protein n=1 Tax=Psychrobacillus TaxID=1221880 RepID=UPI00146E637A|nr:MULTISPECIES: Mu transposase C-terminal domain-containing protein [Psychrobacillus]NME06894.1 transposase [Psychrobacillus sp. BL-248-WT-3]